MTRHEKLRLADELEAEAKRLRMEAFDERPLPDYWREGQKVRFLKDKEYAWPAGTIAQIVEVQDPDKPAAEYQVFWTATTPGMHRFWTTPDEIELVNDEL